MSGTFRVRTFLRWGLLAAALICPRLWADDLALFLNGDVLHGRLDGMSGPDSVRWTVPGASERPLLFRVAALQEIRLDDNDRKTALSEDGAALVEFTNGDLLSGTVLSADDRFLVLKPLGAETVARAPMAYVRALFPNGGKGCFIYGGPRGPEGWKTLPFPGRKTSGSWRYRDGAFYASDTPCDIIGDFSLPPQVSLSFKLRWLGPLNFTVRLYADRENNDFMSTGFQLAFQNERLSFRRYAGGEGMRYFGDLALPDLFNANEIRARIVTDLENAGTITLFIDDVLVKRWDGAGTFAKENAFLAFSAQSKVCLSDIRVVAASGPDKTATKDQALVTLANGDRFVGDLRSIAGNALLFNAVEHGEIRLPMARVSRVETVARDRKVARKRADDARLFFRGVGQIVGQIQIRGDGVSFRSDNIPDTLFKLDAVDVLQFNVYRARLYPDQNVKDQW